MEKGTLRCDANISVREVGEEELRTRWELKNMNSFAYIGRGIDAAVREQIALHEAGEEVVQETYDYDPDRDTLTPHRTKEEAEDYRYFPEPDLVPVEPEAAMIERLAAELPELPAARVERVRDAVGYDAAWELVTTGRDGEFDKLTGAGIDPRIASNVVRNEAAGVEIAEPAELARIVEARDRLSRDTYLAAIAASATAGFTADEYLAQELVSDDRRARGARGAGARRESGPGGRLQGRQDGLLGFFVGQVMKESGGRANPKRVNELVSEAGVVSDDPSRRRTHSSPRRATRSRTSRCT